MAHRPEPRRRSGRAGNEKIYQLEGKWESPQAQQLLLKEQVTILDLELVFYRFEKRREAIAVRNRRYGIPDAETARQLGCSENEVKILIEQGIEDLRRRIKLRYDWFDEKR